MVSIELDRFSRNELSSRMLNELSSKWKQSRILGELMNQLINSRRMDTQLAPGVLDFKFIEIRAFEHSNSTELRSEAARAVL